MPNSIRLAITNAKVPMARICAENLLAGVRGEPLPHWVNPEVAGNRRK